MAQDERLQEALQAIRRQGQGTEEPRVGIILGSGLGPLADEVEGAATVPYGEIPHFPVSTVVGHAGRLVLGRLAGKAVAVMQGRFHYYEGYSMQEVTFPLRVLHGMGIHHLVVTNAAGGINRVFRAGDLMLIRDHINLMGDNPLRGSREEDMEKRFPDMSEVYSPDLRQVAKQVAREQALDLREGVYAGLSGPSYETPAEINFLRIIGADAVGMSTVPEVIVAAQLRLPVLGISLISNMAAGVLPQKLSHREVMEAAEEAGGRFRRLVRGILAAMPA